MLQNAMAIIDWDDLEKASNDPEAASEEVITFHEDIIAITCVAYRLRTNPAQEGLRYSYSPIDEAKQLAKYITQEDRDMAYAVRKFYNGKLVLAGLRGQRLTKFRTELAELLSMTPDDLGEFKIKKKFAGMIYKLPYFYEYDQDLIQVFDGEYRDIVYSKSKLPSTSRLKFVKKMDPYKKRNPQYHYWFTDRLDNRVLIKIEKNNPLDALFEDHVRENDIAYTGNLAETHRDTLSYYTTVGFGIETLHKG